MSLIEICELNVGNLSWSPRVSLMLSIIPIYAFPGYKSSREEGDNVWSFYKIGLNDTIGTWLTS